MNAAKRKISNRSKNYPMFVYIFLATSILFCAQNNAHAEDKAKFSELLAEINQYKLGQNSSEAARESVLTLENQAIEIAYQLALQERSEASFDDYLKKIVMTVEETGIDSKPHESLHRIISLVDQEKWERVELFRFDVFISFKRNQGIAVDSSGNYIFSGSQKLTHPSLSLTPTIDGDAVVENEAPIPSDLTALGDNHIGDIDVADGKVYASFEDSPQQQPSVGIFDAKTLGFQKSFRLPVSRQKNGVPWVAVDASSGRVFSSLYGNVSEIFVYDEKTFESLPSIQLSRPIHSIQGAKVLNGMMYLTSDGDKKLIYKVNLSTGTVIGIHEFGSDIQELEGLTFNPNKKAGTDIELDVLANGFDPEAPDFLRKLTYRSEVSVMRKIQDSKRNELKKKIGNE